MQIEPSKPQRKYNRRSLSIAKKQQEIIDLKVRNPNMTQEEIGKITHRDKSTVNRTLKRYGIDGRRLQGYKQVQADILAGYKERIIQGITEKKIEDTNLRDLAVTFGILDDKEYRLRQEDQGTHALSSLIERLDKQERVTITQTKVEIERNIKNYADV